MLATANTGKKSGQVLEKMHVNGPEGYKYARKKSPFQRPDFDIVKMSVYTTYICASLCTALDYLHSKHLSVYSTVSVDIDSVHCYARSDLDFAKLIMTVCQQTWCALYCDGLLVFQRP